MPLKTDINMLNFNQETRKRKASANLVAEESHGRLKHRLTQIFDRLSQISISVHLKIFICDHLR